jgi:hypothetical protein
MAISPEGSQPEALNGFAPPQQSEKSWISITRKQIPCPINMDP